MNNNKPVQLSQKIDYLFEKITRVHSEIKKNYDLEYRLNFEEFIDTCIRSIIAIKDISSPIKNNKFNQKKKINSQEYHSLEIQKLDFEKKILKSDIKQLQTKKLLMEYQSCRLQLTNKEKQLEDVKSEKAEIRRENLKEIQKVNNKCRNLEQEMEKLIKLNRAQQQQMNLLRQERKRAQSNFFQLQQKYDAELAKLQKFSDKKPKYIDRNTEGLRCIRYFTNTSVLKNAQKLIFLKLPVTLQVNKLVYGIMIGVQLCNSKEIGYYDKFQLYEKEETHIGIQKQYLIVKYKKRKDTEFVILDKYVVRSPQIVVMLFGKGDSIIVHDEIFNSK